MHNWSLWITIKDNVEDNLLSCIQALFPFKLFYALIIQSKFTHKALRCIELIDEFGAFKNVTSTKICDHLEV